MSSDFRDAENVSEWIYQLVGEQVDRVAEAIYRYERNASEGAWRVIPEGAREIYRGMACAALDAATPPHARDPIVAAVQDAVITAMNTLGVTSFRASFELFESSPVPDTEVARIVRAVVGSVGGE